MKYKFLVEVEAVRRIAAKNALLVAFSARKPDGCLFKLESDAKLRKMRSALKVCLELAPDFLDNEHGHMSKIIQDALS